MAGRRGGVWSFLDTSAAAEWGLLLLPKREFCETVDEFGISAQARCAVRRFEVLGPDPECDGGGKPWMEYSLLADAG